MKKIICLTVLLFIWLNFPCFADTHKVIYVDTRLMILAHPLYKVFDVSVNRFRGTCSEPILDGYKGVNAEIEKIKAKQDKLLKSPLAMRKELKNVPLADRIKAEKDYFIKKKEVESELLSDKMRVYMARMYPESMGMTTDESILPQIREISTDLRNVVNLLKKKYSSVTVIDIAEIQPISYDFNMLDDLLRENLQSELYSENLKLSKDKMFRWMKKASGYWACCFGVDSDVIPYGAYDARLEAVKLMEEIKGEDL